MEENNNIAAAAAVAAAAAAPCCATTQRQDDIMFYDITVPGIIEHVVEFMSSPTEVLLFACACRQITKQVVHAYENTASFNGWEIIIGSPITEPEDDASVETHQYDAYDRSDDESIPPPPPHGPEIVLASKINDQIIHRMLASLSRCISKPIKLISIRDCVNVDGTGLEPLRYFDFTQVEHLDLGSLSTVHHGGLTSRVMSTLMDILPAAQMKLKFLRLPEGWLAVFPQQYKYCIGACCAEKRQWNWAREWCHKCGSGPYCELSDSLVMCKQTGEKFCKSTCVRGDDWGDPFWGDHNAAGCPLAYNGRCNKWHCLCGCNDWRKNRCITCHRIFHCCMKKCDHCYYFACKDCYEESHYSGECSGECEICDLQWHASDLEYCEYCHRHICRECCANGHREVCLAELNSMNNAMED